GALGILKEHVLELGVVQAVQLQGRGIQLGWVQLPDRLEQALEVPLLGVDALGAVLGARAAAGVAEEADGLVAQLVAAFQDAAAGLVDDLALLVHDLVVLEDVLAGLEGLPLDPSLVCGAWPV